MKTIWVMAVVLCAAAAVQAHHGFTAFDKNTVVTMKGTVKEFHYVNPHSVVDFEVKDAQGKVRRWQGEMTSPSHLSPKGWTATSLEAGDEITVSGYPGKNGVPSIWVTQIRMPDGKELKVEAGN
ncbi:MAG: DUF6152 family protein [Acidobacteriota bacterium]